MAGKNVLPRVGLTGFGVSAIVLGLLVLVMAVNYSNNLLFTGVYFWFSLLITSGIRGWMQFCRLPQGQWHYAELFARTDSQLTLRLEYAGFDGHLYLKGEPDCIWRVEIAESGMQTLLPPPLVGEELLGLWRYRIAAPALPPLCVYACPHPHLSLEQHLQQATIAQSETDEISYLRPWVVGDSFRSVDWKTTARNDSGDEAQWICREYDGEQSSPLCFLDWHELPSLSEQQRRETLTAWVLELFAQNQPWALVLPEQALDADCSYRHRVSSLRALAGGGR